MVFTVLCIWHHCPLLDQLSQRVVALLLLANRLYICCNSPQTHPDTQNDNPKRIYSDAVGLYHSLLFRLHEHHIMDQDENLTTYGLFRFNVTGYYASNFILSKAFYLQFNYEQKDHI